MVVSPRLAGAATPVPIELPLWFPQRFHLQGAYYDPGVAGAIGAVAVAGGDAAVATAVDCYYYQHGSTDYNDAIACAEYAAGSPSVATIKIRFMKLQHLVRTTTTTIRDDVLPCRSEPVAALIMFNVGKRHDVCPGSLPDSHVFHKCSFHYLQGQQANYLAQISRPTAEFSPIPLAKSEVKFPIFLKNYY